MIDSLSIPKNKFISSDLTKKLNLKRKFDLVLCLEVAEHLEEKYSDMIITARTQLNLKENK